MNRSEKQEVKEDDMLMFVYAALLTIFTFIFLVIAGFAVVVLFMLAVALIANLIIGLFKD